MLNTETIPDVAIAAFLKSKGIDAAPPAPSSRLGGGINGLITGTYGPLAGAAGFALSAQERNARLQEWTSWKQWAIGHSDWPHFWESNREILLRQQAEIVETNAERQAKEKETIELIGLIIFGMATWGIGPAIFVWKKYGRRWPMYLLMSLGAAGILSIVAISNLTNKSNSPLDPGQGIYDPALSK